MDEEGKRTRRRPGRLTMGSVFKRPDAYAGQAQSSEPEPTKDALREMLAQAVRNTNGRYGTRPDSTQEDTP